MITNAIEELNATERYETKLLRFCFKLWKGLLRIVEILAMRHKNNLQAVPRPFCNAAFHLLLWEFWKYRGNQYKKFKERWEKFWYYVPLSFQMWLFLRYVLRPTTSAHEAHNEMTHLMLRKQWCFWVVENHQKQKRRVKLWLILASNALDNDEKRIKNDGNEKKERVARWLYLVLKAITNIITQKEKKRLKNSKKKCLKRRQVTLQTLQLDELD